MDNVTDLPQHLIDTALDEAYAGTDLTGLAPSVVAFDLRVYDPRFASLAMVVLYDRSRDWLQRRRP